MTDTQAKIFKSRCINELNNIFRRLISDMNRECGLNMRIVEYRNTYEVRFNSNTINYKIVEFLAKYLKPYVKMESIFYDYYANEQVITMHVNYQSYIDTPREEKNHFDLGNMLIDIKEELENL